MRSDTAEHGGESHVSRVTIVALVERARELAAAEPALYRQFAALYRIDPGACRGARHLCLNRGPCACEQTPGAQARSVGSGCSRAPVSPLHRKGFSMNKDQVKGMVKEAAGKAQKKVGQLIGNQDQVVKGTVKQAEGKTQQVVGDAKQLVKDVTHKP
jgi:uncharacterized protein YjbJ (UPF0337 family)